MIEVIEQSMPQAKVDDILLWMNRVEADEFIASLKAEIAKLVATATNVALDRPHYLISNPQIIDHDVEGMLRAAARLQMCVDVFEDKRSGGQTLISATIKVT